MQGPQYSFSLKKIRHKSHELHEGPAVRTSVRSPWGLRPPVLVWVWWESALGVQDVSFEPILARFPTAPRQGRVQREALAHGERTEFGPARVGAICKIGGLLFWVLNRPKAT